MVPCVSDVSYGVLFFFLPKRMWNCGFDQENWPEMVTPQATRLENPFFWWEARNHRRLGPTGYLYEIYTRTMYIRIYIIYIYTFYVLLSKYRTYVNILYDIWMLYLHNSLIHPLSAGEISPFPLQLGSRMRRKRRAGSWSMAMSSGNPGGSTDNVQIAEDRAPM